MLKRFALMIAATAVLAIPTTERLRRSGTNADGVLPDELCHAVYPYHTQAAALRAGRRGVPDKLELVLSRGVIPGEILPEDLRTGGPVGPPVLVFCVGVGHV